MRKVARSNSYRMRLGTKSSSEAFRDIRRAILECNDGSAKMLGQ
jgi:hypothetical protein